MTFCSLLANQMTVEGQRLFFKLIQNIMLPITDPLSLGQDYETEAECIPELNLTGRQGFQVADSNLNMSVVSRHLEFSSLMSWMCRKY